MAIVISFRVYRKATIPIELQNLDMIRNQISKKKAISRRRLGKTKDEEILKRFALDWRVLGLNLGDILGIKQIQEHMAQHDKEVASLDKSDAVVDEKIIELEDKIRGSTSDIKTIEETPKKTSKPKATEETEETEPETGPESDEKVSDGTQENGAI